MRLAFLACNCPLIEVGEKDRSNAKTGSLVRERLVRLNAVESYNFYLAVFPTKITRKIREGHALSIAIPVLRFQVGRTQTLFPILRRPVGRPSLGSHVAFQIADQRCLVIECKQKIHRLFSGDMQTICKVLRDVNPAHGLVLMRFQNEGSDSLGTRAPSPAMSAKREMPTWPRF